MKPCNVLFLIESLNVGGSEMFLANLLARLDKTEFRPIVCCLVERGRLAQKLEARGVPVKVLSWRLGSGTSTAATVGRIARLLKEERIELIQTFFHRPEILAGLAGIFVRKPVIVASQYDLIVPKGNLSRLLLRACRPRVKHVIANCRACKLHRERLTGQRPDDISVIYIGLTRDEYICADRADVPLPGDLFEKGPVVTFAGRLLPLKGPDVYLRAAASVLNQCPQTRFLLIGAGPMREELVSLSGALGLTGVVYFVPEVSSIREVFSKSTIAVSSSRSEGFPITVMEAMGVGVPVVASRVGGVEELIQDRVDGFLFENEDSEGLASEIIALLTDAGMARELGARAREKVTKEFRFEETVARIESLYRELLAYHV